MIDPVDLGLTLGDQTGQNQRGAGAKIGAMTGAPERCGIP